MVRSKGFFAMVAMLTISSSGCLDETATEVNGVIVFSGEKLTDARVTLVDAATLEMLDSTISDEQGQFTLDAPSKGTHLLIARHDDQDGLFQIQEVQAGSTLEIDMELIDSPAEEAGGVSPRAGCTYTTYYGTSAYTCKYCDGNDPDIDTAVTFNLNESFIKWGISHNIAAVNGLGSTILWYHNYNLLVNQKYVNGKYRLETVMGDWYKYFTLEEIRKSLKVTNYALCPG